MSQSSGFNFDQLGSIISTLGGTAATIISATKTPTATNTSTPSNTTPLAASPSTGVSSWFSTSGNIAVIGLGIGAVIIMVMMMKKK